MRNILITSVLVAALAGAGCSSHQSAGSLLGPTDPSGLSSSGTLTATPPTPPSPPTPVPGFYGIVSDLNLTAGTFTVTSPSGATSNVVTDANTKVLYKGATSTVSGSVLADGEYVTVSGQVSGLNSHAQLRAQLIIVNANSANQQIVTGP